MKTFWINVKRHLERRGMSQRELCDRIGVSINSLGSWLKNDRLPDLDNAVAIGQALGYSVETLGGYDGAKDEDDDIRDIYSTLSDENRRLVYSLVKALSGQGSER